jgi:hypothetical protein
VASSNVPRTKESKHGTRNATERAQVALGKGLKPETWANTAFGDDLLAARWDIQFFSERFLGITPHPGQIRLWDAILKRDSTGWRPRYLDVNCAAGNRAGKTLGIAIPILWSTMFKHGMEPPNPLDERALSRWANIPYEAFHFAISQEVSELAYLEITRMLAGRHEAQKNGCPLTDQVGEGFADWSRKYRGEYLWIVLNSVFGGGEMHFRTTGEKAIGQLGKDMNLITYDEGAFDPHFVFVVNEVLHLRRLSTGGQLIIVGTSTEGLTDFADRWAEGDPEAPDRKRDAISLRISSRENIGYGIDQDMFDRIVASMPRELIPQNIDGYFLQGRSTFFSAKSIDDCFVHDLEERTPVVKGHRYVNGVDPVTTFDSTWAIVLDVTQAGQGIGVFADRHFGRTTGQVVAALTTAAHMAYSQRGIATCETGIDATGFGGKIFRDLLYIEPLRSVEFGGTRGRKLRLLNTVKAWLEGGKLRFPRTGRWLELRRQLLGYKLDDKHLETDAVMALAVAVYLAAQVPEGSVPTMAFDYFGMGEPSVSSHEGVGFAPPSDVNTVVTSISGYLPRGR